MAGSPRVLVIEDHVLVREALSDLLTERGCSVYQAEDGRSGLGIAKEVKPNVIISDYVMPDMDGLSVVKQIKSDIELADIPVLILSVCSDPSVRRRCIEAGAYVYLDKTAGATEVLVFVDAALNDGSGIGH